MLQVEKWSLNKHPLLAAFAQFMAFHSDDLYEAMKEVKEDRISIDKFPYPELETWQNYYRSSRPLLEFMSVVLFDNKSALSNFKKALTKNQLFLEFSGSEKKSFLKKQVYLPHEEQSKNIVVKKENSEEIYQSSVNFLVKEIDGKNTELINTLKSRITSTSELSFLFRVYLPCWYFFGKLPSQLLREARLGDLQSLETLIRIDSSVIFDKKISAILHNLRNNSPRKHNELMDCIFKQPKGNVSKQKVKCLFASLIWIISKSINLPLTEPEVRQLFDAVAQDKGQGDIDTDLPESPHAFYVAMQREIKGILLGA